MPIQKVYLAIDEGFSLTKVVYAVEGNAPQKMTMPPETQWVSPSLIKKEGMGETAVLPESVAWVQLPTEEEAVAVGLLAKRFSGSSRLKELKFEMGIYKVLAIVGAIAEREKLPSRFDVHLGILLPFGERHSREQFKTQLLEKLKNFSFGERKLSVRVKEYLFRLEGAGLFTHRLQSQGENWLVQKDIGILMCGHRNTSFLLFRGGAFANGSMQDLGFFQLVEKVAQRSWGVSKEGLSEILYQVGATPKQEDKTLQLLVRSQQKENRVKEIEQLVEAIQSARTEYWRGISNWLNEVMPPQLGEVCIGGGAASYLRSEINNYLEPMSYYWGRDLQKIVTTKLNLNADDPLGIRFMDVYGLFSLFEEARTAQIKPETPSEETVSPSPMKITEKIASVI